MPVAELLFCRGKYPGDKAVFQLFKDAAYTRNFDHIHAGTDYHLTLRKRVDSESPAASISPV